MTMKLKPLGSRVVIEPLEQEDVTAGGILSPRNRQRKTPKGYRPGRRSW